MITVSGSYNTALCYCRELQEDAELQILAICEELGIPKEKVNIILRVAEDENEKAGL